ADVDVRPKQRLAVEDDLPVGQTLQPVGIANLGDRKLAEGLGRLEGERTEPILQLGGDVEDVLVVGLFEFQPHTGGEPDGVRRAVEDLHRVGVEGALRLRDWHPHEVFWACHGRYGLLGAARLYVPGSAPSTPPSLRTAVEKFALTRRVEGVKHVGRSPRVVADLNGLPPRLGRRARTRPRSTRASLGGRATGR